MCKLILSCILCYISSLVTSGGHLTQLQRCDCSRLHHTSGAIRLCVLRRLACVTLSPLCACSARTLRCGNAAWLCRLLTPRWCDSGTMLPRHASCSEEDESLGRIPVFALELKHHAPSDSRVSFSELRCEWRPKKLPSMSSAEKQPECTQQASVSAYPYQKGSGVMHGIMHRVPQRSPLDARTLHAPLLRATKIMAMLSAWPMISPGRACAPDVI